MANNARLVVFGAGTNFLVSVALVSAVLTVGAVTQNGIAGVLAFAFYLLVDVVMVGPFALVTGAIIVWWLAARGERFSSVTRLAMEAAIGGGLLGATYPFVANVLRLKISVNWQVLVLGVGCGVCSGTIVSMILKRRIMKAA